ncbi:uncharacterized protein HLK63_L10395 [Nakaseomyces glabratus]|nr:uncharacterized protein GW608_L10395 [Nakaseomyces glabratus]UCS28271.1 uncharacterized protein HLK63_L10395 [Nakaseomyces glabratus]UCS33500.1 uncharacterized protein HLK64_L10395 [Nakaseomyces glabratus]UCS38729.1 uncharacterized protein HLK62_L10395 [Nakaseomyces glabratus]
MKQTTTAPSASLTQVRITVPLPCYWHWSLEGYSGGDFTAHLLYIVSPPRGGSPRRATKRLLHKR